MVLRLEGSFADVSLLQTLRSLYLAPKCFSISQRYSPFFVFTPNILNLFLRPVSSVEPSRPYPRLVWIEDQPHLAPWLATINEYVLAAFGWSRVASPFLFTSDLSRNHLIQLQTCQKSHERKQAIKTFTNRSFKCQPSHIQRPSKHNIQLPSQEERRQKNT